MDRYVVIGNPVSHSLSPAIHARFAAQCGERIEYATLSSPLDGFAAAARTFFQGGGRGANVTLPFKVDAFRFADIAAERARAAQAANFLVAREGRIECDNTDGTGLVVDLTHNLGVALAGARILLLGAGGAARGVLAPLLEARPRELVVANRTPERARELARRFAARGPILAVPLDAIPGGAFDLVVNATSTSTRGEALDVALPGEIAFAYDMAYGAAAEPFLALARSRGARTADGLGMLVEQAAESFALWRGVRPDTAPVLAQLREMRR